MGLRGRFVALCAKKVVGQNSHSDAKVLSGDAINTSDAGRGSGKSFLFSLTCTELCETVLSLDAESSLAKRATIQPVRCAPNGP